MNKIHRNDSVLDGFNVGELIDTVSCNEEIIDEAAINRVFEEMLQYQISEAREMFKAQIKNIKKELK